MENQETQGSSAPSAADSPKITIDTTTLEIAKLGYETAIQLWEGESQNRHSEDNSMLVTNSLILAAIGFSYQTTNLYPPVKYFLPIVGIIMCLAWYMSAKRAIEKAIFWIYCAREIEGNFFHNVFKQTYRGHLFSKGVAIEFILEGKGRLRRMKFWGRLVKKQVLFNFVILIFVIMYIAILAIEIM